MRALALMLLVCGLLGAPVAVCAQEPYADPDFGFTMNLPSGLHRVSPEERAIIMGTTVEAARNLPRGELPPGAPLAHRDFWVDRGSPYNRQMDVHLFDGPPPYMKAEDLVAAYAGTGLKVDLTEPVKAPVGGLRIEGTFTNPQGVPMRKTVVYVPDRAKYAIVSLQAFAGDWAIVQPEFLQAILSIRLQRQAPPPGAVAGAGGKGARGRPGAGGAGGAAAAPGATLGSGAPIDWGELPVTGSLVLSALLLAHLLLGARGPR